MKIKTNNAFIMEIKTSSSRIEGRIFSTKEELIKGWKNAYKNFKENSYAIFDKNCDILIGGNTMDLCDLDILEALPSE